MIRASSLAFSSLRLRSSRLRSRSCSSAAVRWLSARSRRLSSVASARSALALFANRAYSGGMAASSLCLTAPPVSRSLPFADVGALTACLSSPPRRAFSLVRSLPRSRSLSLLLPGGGIGTTVLVTPLLETTGTDPVRMWCSVMRVRPGIGSAAGWGGGGREDEPEVEGCILLGAEIVNTPAGVDVDGAEASAEMDRLRR